MLTLPESLRSAFKEPLGPVYTETDELLAAADSTAAEYDRERLIIAIGDVVTYHLRVAGVDPAVAIIDGKTKREAVGEDIARVLDGDADRIAVENPAAAISPEAIDALRDALTADGSTVIYVTGEEDLLTLPAILAAPLGASIVYGQPDEGMVLVAVTEAAQEDARALFDQLEGDTTAMYDRLIGER